jgi:hypothetical protein
VTPKMPARGGLLKRLAIAAMGGAFLVFCVILPAEYRMDPTGFGRLTGLMELSTPRVTEPEPAAAAPAETATASPSQNSWLFPAPYKTETIQIPLGRDGELEYKIKMAGGQALVYSWKSDKGTVYYDFHGQPPDDPKASRSYKVDEEISSANGAFVAPFDGIHGWYWVNLSGDPMVITLKISGFYESHDYVR